MMKYLLATACCCLLACHQLPEAESTVDGGGGDGDSDSGSLSSDGGMDDMLPGSDVGPTIATVFRTTRGLVAQFSMRGVPGDREIVDDTDPNQVLRTTDGEDEEGDDGKLVLENDETATGSIASASMAIAASGKWSTEVWLDLRNAGGRVLTSGTVTLGITTDQRVLELYLSVDDARFLVQDRALATGMVHLVATHDGLTTRLYVNGFVAAATHEAYTGVFGTELEVGNSNLTADIEYIALYDRALGPGEVAMHTAVGPNPGLEQERDDATDTIFAQPFCVGCGRATSATERSIRPDLARSGLQLGGEYRALQQFAFNELPPYAANGTILFAGYRLISGWFYSSGQIELIQLLKPWSTDVTWAQRTSSADETWEAEGVAGPTDRAEVPVATATMRGGLPDYLFFDVTEIMKGWLDGSIENHGWMLVAEQTEVDYAPTSADTGFAARPGLLVVGAAAQRPEPPAPPTNAMAVVVGEDLQILWDGADGGPDYEVYRDGFLAGRTSSTNILLPISTDPVVWEVFSIDGFGQRSAGVTAQ